MQIAADIRYIPINNINDIILIKMKTVILTRNIFHSRHASRVAVIKCSP